MHQPTGQANLGVNLESNCPCVHPALQLSTHASTTHGSSIYMWHDPGRESDSKKWATSTCRLTTQLDSKKEKSYCTRKCYEGIRLPGHLSLPLMHIWHGLHLPNRLTCYLHTQANTDACL